MQEAQVYINNVIKKTGDFEYAPPRTPLTHLDLCRKPTSGETNTRIYSKSFKMLFANKKSLIRKF